MFQGQYGANRRTDGKEGTEIWFSIPLISNEVDRDQFVMDDDAIQINPATNTMKLLNTKKFAFDKHFSGPQNRSKVKTSQKVIFSYFEMIERSTFLISFAFSYPFSSSVTFFFGFCTGLSSSTTTGTFIAKWWFFVSTIRTFEIQFLHRVTKSRVTGKF